MSGSWLVKWSSTWGDAHRSNVDMLLPTQLKGAIKDVVGPCGGKIVGLDDR
jgi:hypothetical protein